MLKLLFEKLPYLKENWEQYKHLFLKCTIPPKTVLLKEGSISQNIFLIEKGFLVLTIIHLVYNRVAVKNHFRKLRSLISREAISAILLVIMVVGIFSIHALLLRR